MDYNERTMKRNVICIKCRLVRETTEASPLCLECGEIMITTIRSTVTGDVITGEKTNEDTYKI
jgi:hypothetical protein